MHFKQYGLYDFVYSLFVYNLVKRLIVWKLFWIFIMFYNKVYLGKNMQKTDDLLQKSK